MLFKEKETVAGKCETECDKMLELDLGPRPYQQNVRQELEFI